jgi:hypothetical protein
VIVVVAKNYLQSQIGYGVLLVVLVVHPLMYYNRSFVCQSKTNN